MTITALGQIEYGGLRLDGDYELQLVEGLGLPEIRAYDHDRLRRHGEHPGDDFYAGRSVVLTVAVTPHDQTEFSAAVSALRAAFVGGGAEAAMSLRMPGVADGVEVQMWCRPRRMSLPLEVGTYMQSSAVAVIEVHATDPRLYAAAESSGQTDLTTDYPGIGFDLSFDLDFGGVTGDSGIISCVNAGSFDAPVLFRVDGPVDTPKIENVTTGDELEFDIVLTAGQYLLVDTSARTVLLNGTASRYSTLTTASAWFDLPPGTTEVRFFAATATAATLSATWRSAWL